MTTFSRVAACAFLYAVLLSAAARAQTVAPTADAPAPERAATPIDVQVAGHGEPELIFIPGLACSGSVWDHVVARFEAGYRCHVVTLAGFGGKPPIQSAHYLDDMADAIIAYVHEQKLVRPVIIGHSIGGVLALKIAIKEPDLPGRLVIVDSLPFPAALQAPDIHDADDAQKVAEKRRREFLSQTPEQFVAGRLKYLLDSVTSPEQARALAVESGKCDQATTTQAVWEVVSGDLRPSLEKIKCPTLVMGSMADKLAKGLPEDLIEISFHRQYRNLPGVRYAFFEKARHFIMVDDIDGFTDALRNELKAP